MSGVLLALGMASCMGAATWTVGNAAVLADSDDLALFVLRVLQMLALTLIVIPITGW